MRLVSELLERLLDYRAVMNDENKTYSMSCTVNLLVSTVLCSSSLRLTGAHPQLPGAARACFCASPGPHSAPGTAERGCTWCQSWHPLGVTKQLPRAVANPIPVWDSPGSTMTQSVGGCGMCHPWGHSNSFICLSTELLQGD